MFDVRANIPGVVLDALSEEYIILLVEAMQTAFNDYTESIRILPEYRMLNPAMAIKSARKAAGFTQKQMSEQLGVPRRTLEDWERGLRTPAPYVQNAIVLMLWSMRKK